MYHTGSSSSSVGVGIGGGVGEVFVEDVSPGGEEVDGQEALEDEQQNPRTKIGKRIAEAQRVQQEALLHVSHRLLVRETSVGWEIGGWWRWVSGGVGKLEEGR